MYVLRNFVKRSLRKRILELVAVASFLAKVPNLVSISILSWLLLHLKGNP